MKTPPFLPYNTSLVSKARENRKNASPMENTFWYEILSGNRTGYKFLRQKPILNFIVDFYCPKLILVIEIDGDSHAEQLLYDEERTKSLNSLGIKVLRYTNSEVMQNIEGVYDDLMKEIVIREEELKNKPPKSLPHQVRDKLLSGGFERFLPLDKGGRGDFVVERVISAIKNLIQNPLNPSRIKYGTSSSQGDFHGKNLVFIGMRGSGKTTFGKAFAEKYGLDFIDTDEEIEKKTGRKISEIVQENGWEYFRALEREMCAEAARHQNTVISVGGGAVMDESNVQVLKENGIFIFLWTPLDELERWLSSPESKRPALTDGKSLKEEIEMVWRERRSTYFETGDFVYKLEPYL